MEERRKEDANLTQLLGLMRSLLNDFGNHGGKLVEIDKKIDTILAAFPVNGLMAHRMYHEAKLREEISSENLRASIRGSIASKGALVVIGVLLYALWEYFRLRVMA